MLKHLFRTFLVWALISWGSAPTQYGQLILWSPAPAHAQIGLGGLGLIADGAKPYCPTGTTTYVLTTGINWTVPSCFNPYNNAIYVIGGGASGGVAWNGSSAIGATGGGSGCYAKYANLALTPGQSVQYAVGAGGAAVSLTTTGTASGNSGGTTYFDGASYGAAPVGAGGGLPGAASNSTVASSGGCTTAEGTSTQDGTGSGAITAGGHNCATGGAGAPGPTGAGDGSSAISCTSAGATTAGGAGDAGLEGTGGAAGGGAGGNGTGLGGSAGAGGGGGGNNVAGGSGGMGGTYGAGTGASVCRSGNCTSPAAPSGVIVITSTNA